MKQSLLMRILKALGYFMLLSAILHIIIILVHSIMNGDMHLFNYFDVLDLDLFFPNIAKGSLSFTLSTIISLGQILLFFIILGKKKK